MASVASPATGSSPDSIAAKAASPAIALVALALVVLLQVELVFSKSINWDEYFHFSLIHQHEQQEQVQWLQTPFVWLFGWVPGLPGDVIGHIQLIRLMILPFELLTAMVIFDSARRLAGREAAFVTTLAYLTGGYIFLQSFALRADMIAAGLLMAALWIFLWRPLRALELAAIGLLVGLALIATIKSALYAPAFLGVVIMRRQELFAWNAATKRLMLGATVAAGAVVLAGFATGYAWDVIKLAQNSASRMFSAGFFPQWKYLSAQLVFGPFLTLMLGAALPILILGRKRQPHALVLILFLLPLLSIAVYRNAYPYFFGFIFAPAMIALAPAAREMIRPLGSGVLAVALFLNAAYLWQNEDRGVIERQREVQAGIHQIFPQPVHQIDDVAFVSDFPRAVPKFASGWALEGYRKAGQPEYEQAIRAEPVPLLLRQGYALEQLVPDPTDERALLARDTQVLADNYVQHWGFVYVPGKRIAADAPREIEILAPGPYTVEGAAVEIDGTRLEPGQVIELARGMHAIVPPQTGETVLRYGDHLPVPAQPFPEGRLFTEY
jgi:hypothetical protein